jgi:hypothetical protein
MSPQIPRYPDVKVQLVGDDRNAIAILGCTKHALHDVGASANDVAAFMREATGINYDQLLARVVRWVEAE